MAAIDIVIVHDRELDYVQKRLGNMLKQAPMVIRKAVNQTAKEAKKQDERITKKLYTAKSDINSLQFTKATTANLQAILKDRGANISMSHFNYYAGKRGVSAIINKSHGRKKLSKYGNPAFFNALANGGNGIAVRVSKSRLPIEKMASISSPVMHGNDQTWGTIDEETRQKLHENIEKEIERILGQ